MADKSNDLESSENSDPQLILGNYKQMMADCQQLAVKIQELTMEKDEHRLVVEQLTKLEAERKAYRLVNGVLVERTVGEVLPIVSQNFEGIKELISKLDLSLKSKDTERRAYKEKHGIMTQDEREALLKKKGATAQK